ncbi:MAG TPA: prephenate dehydratase domain-containing protein [Gaiellaceae bacterium]|nr:prephenate dehydratase domain-containing protein [Gaiellaceae bacterium]
MNPNPETAAYPGREGAHAAAAAEALFPEAELLALPSFRAVADAVAAGEVAAGVLPIESTLAGPVNETHDLLYASSLSIVGQVVLPIEHCLAGPAEVSLDSIRTIRSHPMALDQCRDLLASLPDAVAVASATTADAAREVADAGDPTQAAIASPRAVRLYGLRLLKDGVGDHPEAYTRVVSVATYTRLDRNGHPFRTALSFVTNHRPGALHHALEPFARHEIDLVQLVSRPIPHSPFNHRFDAVIRGHPLDPVVNEALAELRSRTRQLLVFGSYPVEEDDVVESGGGTV